MSETNYLHVMSRGSWESERVNLQLSPKVSMARITGNCIAWFFFDAFMLSKGDVEHNDSTVENGISTSIIPELSSDGVSHGVGPTTLRSNVTLLPVPWPSVCRFILSSALTMLIEDNSGVWTRSQLHHVWYCHAQRILRSTRNPFHKWWSHYKLLRLILSAKSTELANQWKPYPMKMLWRNRPPRMLWHCLSRKCSHDLSLGNPRKYQSSGPSQVKILSRDTDHVRVADNGEGVGKSESRQLLRFERTLTLHKIPHPPQTWRGSSARRATTETHECKSLDNTVVRWFSANRFLRKSDPRPWQSSASPVRDCEWQIRMLSTANLVPCPRG